MELFLYFFFIDFFNKLIIKNLFFLNSSFKLKNTENFIGFSLFLFNKFFDSLLLLIVFIFKFSCFKLFYSLILSITFLTELEYISKLFIFELLFI